MVKQSTEIAYDIIGLRNLTSFDSAIGFAMNTEQRRHLLLTELQSATIDDQLLARREFSDRSAMNLSSRSFSRFLGM